MKKTTQNNFSKRLVKYGALSVAMAGIADASGQIIYTDVDPDLTNGGGGTADFIDLDNDGNNDFVLGTTAAAIGLNGVNLTDSWVGSQAAYLYPFAFDIGDTISSGVTGWYGGDMNIGTLNYDSCYQGAGNSNWCGVTDKYLGLRFQIAGNTHYGWARLDVTLAADSFTLKDYAYNSVPGAPIDAGQTLSVTESQLTDIKITSLNKTISLLNVPASTEYQIYSMSGKSVINGMIDGGVHVIEANSLANGVYILELRNDNTKAVIRKKLII